MPSSFKRTALWLTSAVSRNSNGRNIYMLFTLSG